MSRLLQATPAWCTEGKGFEAYLFDFEFINAFSCTASDLGGGFATVATLVLAGVGLSIYVRTGSVALPAILLLLTGGALLSTVAAPALGIATLLILVVGGGAITYAYWRYAG